MLGLVAIGVVRVNAVGHVRRDEQALARRPGERAGGGAGLGVGQGQTLQEALQERGVGAARRQAAALLMVVEHDHRRAPPGAGLVLGHVQKRLDRHVGAGLVV